MGPEPGLRAPYPSQWPKKCPNNPSRAFHGFSSGSLFLQGPTEGSRDSSPQAALSQSPQVTPHNHQGTKMPLQGCHGLWGNHLLSGLKSPLPQANFGHPESLSPDMPHFKDLNLHPAAELCAGHRDDNATS